MIRRLYVLRMIKMIEVVIIIGIIMGCLWRAGFVNCYFC